MERIIFACLNPGETHTVRGIPDVRKGLIDVIEKSGGSLTGQSDPDQNSIIENSEYSLPNGDRTFLKTSYMTFTGDKGLACHLSLGATLTGSESFCGTGASLPKAIRNYIRKRHLMLYRDEITDKGNQQYVEGAFVSLHMRDHGHSVINS